MNSLVLQSYGNEIQHRRTILTILSFYSVVSDAIADYKILLFTDHVSIFKKNLPGLEIEYIPLSPEIISEWTGNFKFIHRMKISILEEAFKRTDGNIIYSDTDSFFLQDPTPLIKIISPGKSYMHECEYTFAELKDLPLPSGEESLNFYKTVVFKEFDLTNGRKIKITEKMSSWNAGIMILHKDHEPLLKDVFKLTDLFFSLSSNHASEQFAFSVVLQSQTELRECRAYCYHYWHRTGKTIVDGFLKKKLKFRSKKNDSLRMIHKARGWINILPSFIENHPVRLRDMAIQAFNENNFKEAYKLCIKAFAKNPLNRKFIADVLYHSKRKLLSK
jgi:hypothetical protein